MPETEAPTRTAPATAPDTTPAPERRYRPDWVCPDQQDQTVRRLKDI